MGHANLCVTSLSQKQLGSGIFLSFQRRKRYQAGGAAPHASVLQNFSASTASFLARTFLRVFIVSLLLAVAPL